MSASRQRAAVATDQATSRAPGAELNTKRGPRPASRATARTVPAQTQLLGERPAVTPVPLASFVAAPGPGTEPPASAPAPGPAVVVPPAHTGTLATAQVPLLMPEPPSGPSPEDRARLHTVAKATAEVAARQGALPSPAASVAHARAAVSEPLDEAQARAEASVVQALEARAAPSANIVQLCAQIRLAIRERRPPDEASLLRSVPQREAERAGGHLDASVRGDAHAVRSDYDALNAPPSATPRPGRPVPPPPAQVATPSPQAVLAMPAAVPAASVSLDADVSLNAQRISDAGMDTPAAQLAQTGPLAQARSAQRELEQLATQDATQVLAQQQAARAEARADMAALEAKALEALRASRANTVASQVASGGAVVLSEEQQREAAARQARGVVQRARTQVEALLGSLPETAMAMWRTGVEALSRDFEVELDRVERWKQERYAQFGGSLVQLYDDLVGLPDWVQLTYDRAERQFGDGVCALLARISARVNGVIAACERLLSDANQAVSAIFSTLPESLRTWAVSQQAQFQEQLNALHENLVRVRDDLTKNIADRGREAVQHVRERIHELRAAAGGLVGRVQRAIAQFLADPARFIINGLLQLAGIVASAFWGVVDRVAAVIDDIANDPLAFANNLARATGDGFRRFFDNFSKHALDGFFDWLFSGLGAVGVSVPREFSTQSLMTFFIELMGFTWERVRALLVKVIGDRNVELLEQAFHLLTDLVAKGPMGLFEMIKERLNPRDLIQQVVRAGVDFLRETLITRIATRLLMLFNPAGALVQAVEVIYRIFDWVFSHAARLFSLVETVVNGAGALVAGNITGMANAIEGSLARLLGPVIDFLAGFLGLGALPERIAETIRGFQESVWRVVERVVHALADRARALVAKLGVGGDKSAPSQDTAPDDVLERGAMQGERHLLTVDFDTDEVLLASKPAPALDKLDRAIKRAEADREEHPQDPRYQGAIDILQNMRGQVQSLLQILAGDEHDPIPQVRLLSRNVMKLMEQYGSKFDVKDIVTRLPTFPGPKVGTHGKLTQVSAQGKVPRGGRESHHVPSFGLALALARRVGEAAEALNSAKDDPVANNIGDLLKTAKEEMEVSAPGNDLSAILIHSTTHRNEGAPSVHASAIAGILRDRLTGAERTRRVKRVRILSTASKQLQLPEAERTVLVNPQKPQLDDFTDRTMALVRNSGADMSVASALLAEVAERFDQLDEADRRKHIPLVIKLVEDWLRTSFKDAYVQTSMAVRVALEASHVDGAEKQKNRALRKLREKAKETWHNIYSPF